MKKRTSQIVTLAFAFFVLWSERAGAQAAKVGDPPLFVVKVDGKGGFINPKGELVIPAIYQNVSPFREGLAAVQIGERWGFIDPAGAMVIPPRFAKVGFFSDGLASFQNEFWEREGYLNRTGKVVIEPGYDEAGDFHNGIARVGIQENGLTPEERKKMILKQVPLDQVQALWLRARKPPTYRFIDRSGKAEKDPGPAHQATGVPGELIPFNKDGKVGYVDADGKIVIEPRFLAANAFFDGLACAREEGLYGFIDKTGKFVIPPRFQYPSDFSNGLAGVPLGEKGWGFIDRTGKTVVEPRFSWILGRFRHGIVEVAMDGEAAYVNMKGEQIWPQSK